MDVAAAQSGPQAGRRRRVPRAGAAVAALLAAVALGALLIGLGDRDAGTPARPTPLPAASPTVQLRPAPDEPVPILMYHVIGPSNVPVRFAQLQVSRRTFAAHIAALRRAGYHAVTLQQVHDAWHRSGRLPRRPIVLTFDDGYVGHVRDALPILRAAGWRGVLNLDLSNVAAMGGSAAVRRLVRAGWEVDSHSLTHRDLTTLSPDALRRELAGSRAAIKRRFGEPANFFSYPNGIYDATIVAAVKDAGYLGATTVKPGFALPAGDPYLLPRILVDGRRGTQWLLGRLRALRPT